MYYTYYVYIFLYVYICIHTQIYIYVYVCIYTERERERAHIFCILYSEDKRPFIEHMGDFDKLFLFGLNFFF